MTDRLLNDAWNAIGELAPQIVPLQDYAEDRDDPLFSDLVIRLKHTVTTIGNTLARLRAENDPSVNDPLPAQTSPEITSAGSR